MARIGFYGGTFNPIHMGHVEVCRHAMKQLRLDSLHVIPTYIPPHKASPELAAGEDRLEMCRLALLGLRGAVADDYELAKGGVSYSVETMQHMRWLYPDDDFYLIIRILRVSISVPHLYGKSLSCQPVSCSLRVDDVRHLLASVNNLTLSII